MIWLVMYIVGKKKLVPLWEAYYSINKSKNYHKQTRKPENEKKNNKTLKKLGKIKILSIIFNFQN
jgi:hypothetical protein